MSFNLSVVEMVAAPLLVYIQGYPTIIFTFKRREKTDIAITVNFAISGSAVLGTHYTQSGATTYNGSVGTIYFAPGETFKNVFIQPINNADFLTGESVVFSLLEGTGYKPTTLNGTIVYILDKAGSVGPVFSIELNPQVIAEDDGITKFIFTFSKSGTHSNPLALNYEVTGTASSVGQPADYTGLSPGPIYTLTFQPIETSKTIEVTVVNDSLIEGNETVIVNLLQGVGYKRSFPIQAIGTIQDDDDAEYIIEFDSPVYYINENNTVVTPIVITRTAGASGTAGVSFVTSNGTATSGLDYTYSTSVVTFYNTETIKIVEVPIIEDILIEGDETINLTLLDPFGGAALGSQSIAILTIVDNDINLNGVIQFNSPTYSVYEDGTVVTPVTLVRVGGSDGTVTVTVFCNEGTATAIDDYDATDIVVEFLTGELTKTIEIPIIEDLLEEGNETVLLELGDVTGGAIIGVQSTATLTIIDNDIVISGPYNFKVLQPSSLEGFGVDEDLGLIGYTPVGIVNTGLGYLAVLKNGTIYKLIDSDITTLSPSGIPFINKWLGGASLQGDKPVIVGSTFISDYNSQSYNVGLNAYPSNPEAGELPGGYGIAGASPRFSQAWTAYTGKKFATPFDFTNTPTAPYNYFPARPDPWVSYSGTANERKDYDNGSFWETIRTYNQTVVYNPAGYDVDGGGSYNRAVNLSCEIELDFPQEFLVFTKDDPLGVTYYGLSGYNYGSWSMTGTSSGDYTAEYPPSAGVTGWAIDYTGQDNYTATGSFDVGSAVIKYVNPVSFVTLNNESSQIGIWNKSFVGEVLSSTAVPTIDDDHYVLFDAEVTITDSFSFTDQFADFELLIEHEDCFIGIQREYRVDYSYSVLISRDGDYEVFGGVPNAQLLVYTDHYTGFIMPGITTLTVIETVAITMELVYGLSLIPLSLETKAMPPVVEPDEYFVLYIADIPYSISLLTDDCFFYIYGEDVTIIGDSMSCPWLGLTAQLNGIKTLTATGSQNTNGHSFYSIHPTYQLLGQEVIVFYKDLYECYECEGVIVTTDELVETETFDINGIIYPSYTLSGINKWSCMNLEIQLNLSTKKDTQICGFEDIGDSYYVVVNKDNYSKLVYSLLTEFSLKSINMYKIDGTVELAVSQALTTTTEQTEWYADIYRFNTTTLKWERMPNGVSALSALSATSSYISYHPTPA